jgi:quinoprotein glucose dehydrogenase
LVFHTGEAGVTVTRGAPPALEATPLVINGTMYFPTPLGKVIALDAATGRERWRHDPGVDPTRGYGDFASRGVAYWSDSSIAPAAFCAQRILFGTIDARLIGLDAATGRRCTTFGDSGIVDLRRGLRTPPFEFQAYQVTSPPAIVDDLVIVGSAIADNNRTAPASGEVRAFDVRSGARRWTFDPIPQAADHSLRDSWRDGSAARTGGANVWSVMVADLERDLVFLPTSSPAPDYFGGARLGDNRYANSVVALRASTGHVVWHFQTVHHDLWDFDNAAPPVLATVTRDGQAIPAVLQATKTGMLFVLHRETGVPLFPVEERRVPASDVPGEVAWPTQPFTALTAPLVPQRYTADDVAWGPSAEDRAWCRAVLTEFRNEGAFTPPSLRGTIVVPSNIGGAHWGGVAVDGGRHIAVVPVNRLAAMVQLALTEGLDADSALRKNADRWFDADYGRMRGTPYSKRRRLFFGPSGLPCTPPPFGSLVAVSLATGSIVWNTPLGDLPSAAVDHSGAPNLGGPLLTASGLVFIAATFDRTMRAFDTDSGRQLWQAPLPAGGRATPMTYEAAGRQFVVIAAGGGGAFGTGDAIVAFALPRDTR